QGSRRKPPARGPATQPRPFTAQPEPASREAPPDQRSTSQGVTNPRIPARGATDRKTAAIEVAAGTNRPWNRGIPGKRGSAATAGSIAARASTPHTTAGGPPSGRE